MDMKQNLLDRFKYSDDSVPKNYGKLIPLGRFLKEVDEGHHKTFMGSGELVRDGKFIEGSEAWVKERVISFNDFVLSLEKAATLVDDLYVFWVSETDLIF